MISPHSFVRRGLEVVQAVSDKQPKQGDDDEPNGHIMFLVGYFVFLLTIIIFSLLLGAIAYTYGHLITALCMVESASANTYVPINTVEDEGDSPPAYSEDGLPKPDDEVNLVRTKPITASLRTTILHLRAKGGFWSRFRGFWCYFVWGIAHNLVVSLLSFGIRKPFMLAIAGVLAEVALTNIHMTWIHVIISEPSDKAWYRRLPRPAFRAWKRMAPAVAIWATCTEIATYLPFVMAGTWGAIDRMNNHPNYSPGTKDVYVTAGQLFFMFVLHVVLFIAIQIPATVAMTRVAASMLPEEHETIVPFDRTFGGMTTPEIIGGQGKIGIVEAWKSFNWECRRRLLRTVAKVAAIVVAVYVLFTIVIMIEGQVFFGNDFGEVMKLLHQFSKGPGANKGH